MFTEGFVFTASIPNVLTNVGKATTHILKQPDRLHLSRIDSFRSGLEIGTILLLAVVTFGLQNQLAYLTAGFEPDFRMNRSRNDLEKWYSARNIFLTDKYGHDLTGGLADVAAACRDIAASQHVDYSISFL